MDATVISVTAPVVTLINVFTVEPGRQQDLVDLLTDATETLIRHRPGFVSANLHASLDGTRVANYAQWESEEAMQAMLADPAAREHLGDALAIATAEPHVYTVASVHHRP